MKKRALSLLLACVLALGCLPLPAGAVEVIPISNTQLFSRATNRFEGSIPAKSIAPLGDSISLDIGETVTYQCIYSPRSDSVKFGFIAPDGLFYGVSGSRGSINKTIRVSQRGSYTLAILNDSDETVTVQGTVNY